MKHCPLPLLLCTSLSLCLSAASAAEPREAAASIQKNYTPYCSACHGADRLGASGPALLPESLARLKKNDAIKTITDGRPATQMPGFKDSLSSAEIAALVEYIYTPLENVPVWNAQQIQASRWLSSKKLRNAPIFKADMLNLFIVVETGDHYATVLDGDHFEPITRFATRYALHGGPKFSPEGRYVYFSSRDGWVSKYDLWNLHTIAEIRVGINTRNIAVSSDGRYLIAANYLPHTVVILNAADLSLLQIIPARTTGGASSRVSAVYDAAPRKSFIVALKDIPELWEIPYDNRAAPMFSKPPRKRSTAQNIAPPARLSPQRSTLDTSLDDFFFDQSYRHLIGASRTGQAQVIDLDTRQKIADLALSGMPHLGSGITWNYQGTPVMATPNLQAGIVSVIDMNNWQVIKQINTPGPGFFMRSHENTPYAWTDIFMGKEKDSLQLIDKQTLEIVKTLTPSPGKTAAHVEFTRDGQYALVSIWEDEGELVIYDAKSLREVKRMPMKKPSGKYNVYNKITRSAGTSH